MKVLILDNYDSFTFNLFHLLDGLGADVIVKRNDEINSSEIGQFEKIILSPGPGLPNESPTMMKVIADWYDKRPMLGVCLGMQALAVHFGDQLVNQKKVTHGMQVNVNQLQDSILFKNIPIHFSVGLCHSWAIECQSTSPFIITSKSDTGVIMSFEHKDYPLFGVQFHPESILTTDGREVLGNFLTTEMTTSSRRV